MLVQLILTLKLLLVLLRLTNADYFDECGDREGLYVASEESCSQYIFCYGQDSFIDDCDEETPYFSETDQTCDVDASVCKVGVGQPSSSSSPVVDEGDDDLEQPSTSQRPMTSISTVKPSQVTTVTSTTNGVYSPTSLSTFPPATSTAATNLALRCPSLDDPQKIVFLRNPKSCTDYFMCYHGEPVPMHCSNTLHFDQKTQKCDYPENVKCQLNFASPRDTCHTYTVDFYPHVSKCNYYYLCQFGYLMVMQCPLNMGWDYEKRTCRRNAKCYKSAEERYVRL